MALSWGDVLLGYLIGLRFDLATIFILNGVFLLFLSLPIRLNQQRRTYKVMNWIIVLVNIPVLIVNGIDVVYFGFAEKRLTHELFTTKSDYQSFQPSMLMEWWWLILFAVVLIVGFYRVLDRSSRRHVENSSRLLQQNPRQAWGVVGLYLLLTFTGVRGGWQKEPLVPAKAYVGETIFVGNLGLNSAYTVLSTVDVGEYKHINWVPEAEAVAMARSMVECSFDGPFEDESVPLLRQSHFEGPEKQYNVVFLIIESLNANLVGSLNGQSLEESLTPNLDTLVRHGRMFTRNYANGVRSIEALPSLLNSMPEIFRRPTIGSHFSSNAHYGLPHILGERGYHTSFFCGAHNGTMGFDLYAKVSGIQHYFGMNEYPKANEEFDGFWGCADGPFMEWMGEQQNSFPEPFMNVFFSISNHHPFKLPPHGAEGIAEKGWSDMEKTTHYTDRVLGAYFEQVSQFDWFDRTIFVLTGDHCFHEQSEPGRTIVENFHVPLLVVAPGVEPGLDDRISNHINVMPTVIDLLQLDTYHSSTGVSLLGERPTFAINSLQGLQTLIEGNSAYTTNFERGLPLLQWEKGVWQQRQTKSVSAEMDLRLRSLYQVLSNARVEDRMVSRQDRRLNQAN